MAGFTSQRSGNWSDASATGPWYVTGTGLPSGGHGPSGVPGAGDGVTIGNTGGTNVHVVTVDVNSALGDSGTDIYFGIDPNATLTIAPGITLTLTCNSVLAGTLNMGPGSILVIDSTAHSHGFWTTGATSYINAVGTSASPAVIKAVGTNAGLIGYTAATSGSIVTYTYVNFTNVQCEVNLESSWIATNCTWTNCTTTPINIAQNLPAGSVFKLINCTFTGTTSTYAASIYVAAGLTGVTIGNRLIQGCSFDAAIIFQRGADGFLISQSVLGTGTLTIPPLILNSASPWVQLDSCLIRWTAIGTATALCGPLTNCIIVTDASTQTDQQGFSVEGGVGLTTSSAVSSGTSLPVTNVSSNLPAGTTLNFGGVGMTLTSAVTATNSATSLPVTTIGGSIASGAQCVAVVIMGNMYQANTNDNDNAPFYTGTTYAPTISTAITIKNNLILPSIGKAPGSSGQMFNISETNGNVYITAEHNTGSIQAATSSIYAMFYIGDESGNPVAGSYVSCRANLGWAATANASNYFVKVKTAAANDVITPSMCGYNGCWNASASNVPASSGWTSPGVSGYYGAGSYLFSTTPLAQTTDVDANPNFVDATRDLSTAYSAAWSPIGGTSSGNSVTDWKATVSYIASNISSTPTLVSTLRSGILSGFAPTNGQLNTTYSGDLNPVTCIGAVTGSYSIPWTFLFDNTTSGGFSCMAM